MLVTRSLPSAVDLLDLHRLAPTRYAALFESTAHGTAHGRWDLLLVASGGSLTLGADGVTRDAAGTALAGDFLANLDSVWRAERIPRDEPRWPFRGGWALMLAYELAAQVEPVLRLPTAPGGLPVACALRCPAAVLRDHATGECVSIAEVGHEALLDDIARDVQAAARLAPLPVWQPPVAIEEDAPQRFTEGVRRVLQYLAAGDVFQVNLSRGWRARFEHALAPAALFQRLRENNPAPFAGVFAGRHHSPAPGHDVDSDVAGANAPAPVVPEDVVVGAAVDLNNNFRGSADWAVVSASPERLVSVRGDVVETRPIAGTRPRFAGDDDSARIRELVGHPKERAEHVMLIDLERNDLGRVCTPGSVEVDELMTVESYAHVHHIVSNVRGRLRDGVPPGEVIRATFPGGTITGCPKVRCMQIIAELEGEGRGAYTGAMGWLNRDGDLDLNILIRSAELEGDTARFRTGAGIVFDSVPERELDETRAKARGMFRALGVDG